jgi:DNA polymerase
VATSTAIACPDCEGTGKSDNSIWYDGVDQFTKRWGPIKSYGGKFFENIVQATARDAFMFDLKNAETAGYPVVTQIHDELVCEVPDTPERTAAKLSAIMATNPPWAVGLPLAAAGHEMFRYGKLD